MNTTDYRAPKACNFSEAQIAGLAEEVARELLLQPGGELESIIGAIGGRIEYEAVDPWRDEAGSIFIDNLGDFRIVLPSHTSGARDRFTVAHELGHYFLHYLLEEESSSYRLPMKAQRYGSGLVEYEANVFAASLLMPEETFKEKHAEFDGHKLLLADFFKVSPSAAAVREKVLKLG